MDNVLVLGANGHVGYNLTEQLIEKGYRVRAGVRSVNDPGKTDHLKALGAEIVRADLLEPATLREAMQDMDGVFQLAAVYNVTAKDPRREVIEPTVTGARNAVAAAADVGIKKMIFTSSVAAVGTVSPGGAPLDEDAWNDNTGEPYSQAKTRSEREAWQLARERGLHMVAMLPGLIIGPGFQRHTPSTLTFELLLRGKIPFVLPLTLSFVDVRDVANAHVQAYENENASGRYIVSNRSMSFREVFDHVKAVAPEVKVPQKQLPARLLFTVPFFDWLSNKLSGTPRFASTALIKEYAHREQNVSAQRARRELGWEPMPIDTSIKDTIAWIRDRFL